MKPARDDHQTSRRSDQGRALGPIEDLVPIAVAIAAGCERCAERAVSRALHSGASPESVDRTLEVVAGMRSIDCLIQSVGAEVTGRMEKPLEAGRAVLRRWRPIPEGSDCCGSAAEVRK